MTRALNLRHIVALFLLCTGVCSAQSIGECPPFQRSSDSPERLPEWFTGDVIVYLRGHYTRPILEIHLLCWQHVRGKMEWTNEEVGWQMRSDDVYHNFHIALVWLRVDDKGRDRWSSAYVWDRYGKWEVPLPPGVDYPIEYYDHPPTSAELYGEKAFDKLFVQPYFMTRSILDGALRIETWRKLTGGEPPRPFPTSGRNRWR